MKSMEKQAYIWPSEISQSGKAIYYMIPIIWHSGKGKTMETIKRSVVAKNIESKKMNRQSTEDFQGSKNTQYDILMMSMSYFCPNLLRCTPPRVSSKVNRGLWVIMMCQCRFTLGKNCTFWWVMLIIGEAMHVWRQVAYDKSLNFLLNFVVNLKLL